MALRMRTFRLYNHCQGMAFFATCAKVLLSDHDRRRPVVDIPTR
jgi:hypothetical protein